MPTRPDTRWTPDELAGWVAAYDAQGWHRTGSRIDHGSARWLAVEAQAAGAAPRVTEYGFLRLVHRASWLGVAGRSAAGVPMFDAGLPPPSGVSGVLGPVGSAADIGVVEAPPAAGDDIVTRARREHAHRALVVITRGQSPGLALRNASGDAPFGPPVLQVGSRHARWVQVAAASGQHGVVEMDARRVSAKARNVEVVVAGAGPLRRPVVVLTPRSGWWHCAAERGGGLACWLAALRDLAATPVRRTVVFLATSGHELGYLGLHRHLAARPDLLGATWVHLGANLAARDGTLATAASDGELGRAVSEAGQAPNARALRDARFLDAPVGEGAELRRAGARYVSFVGTNRYFHLRTDRYPGSVDVDRLAEVAAGVSALVRRLADDSAA